MRNSSGNDSNNFRSKFSYNDEQQHLDPIAEYEDELDLEYGAEDDLFDDNETVDEEEYQYFDNNDRYVIENRKRYIKPAKSRETTTPPTRAKYIYKKKEIESCVDRTHKKHSSKASSTTPLSPVTSKSKVEPPRWSKLPNPASSFQRGPNGRKPEMPFNALMSLNALREKMFGDTLPATPAINMSALEQPLSSTSTHHSKSKRRNMIATEQIHHDSGDGPRVTEPSYKMNLSELLKINDDSPFGGTMVDNEVVANLVNEISTMQSENKRKMNAIDRQKQGMDSYFSGSLNLNTENFRQKMERKNEPDQQHQPPSSTYQPFTHHSLGTFSQNFLEGLNSFPCKKNSSTQTNLGLEDAYMSDHDFKPDSEAKYDEACGHDIDNQNWNGDDVSNIVSSSKEDLSELRNLQKTKRMICELINKEIEKIAKMKNLDMSVSRRFLLQDRESLCNEDFRKTRLDALNNLQNEIKKLITLETVEE